MQNTFIAQLLEDSVPSLDAPTAAEDAVPPTPGVEAVAVEKATERPRSGSFARPVVVRGAGMLISCLWTACDGRLSAYGGDRYLCSICSTWFELLSTDFGVYVGDLAEDFGNGAETEWVM
jgi:hypothetical protein